MAAEKKLSYEQARDELAEIVESLESGSATLEESLALWERGEALAKICQEWLDGAKAKIAASKSTLAPLRSRVTLIVAPVPPR